eukprot:s2736_g7.t1
MELLGAVVASGASRVVRAQHCGGFQAVAPTRGPDFDGLKFNGGWTLLLVGAASQRHGRRSATARAAGGVLPNSKQALQSLRQWRKKQTAEETKVPSPTMAPGTERPWRGNRWRLSKKNLPSCVATWHAWMKSMDAEEFFDTVTKRPELLPAYTEAAQAEGMAGEGNEVCLETADFLERLHAEEGSRPWKIVDLGCGDAALAEEMRRRRPDLEMTCVDAARLARGVVVHNLAALPDDWAAAFDVAVLCRALWSLDYEKVLSEAHRVLSCREEAGGS